jgi:outer membrane protein TolC
VIAPPGGSNSKRPRHGGRVTVPLLDFGRLDAAVEKADVRSRELFLNYKQTVLKCRARGRYCG